MIKALKNLTLQVLIATLLGAIVGIYYPEWGATLKILSDLFVRLITLLVGPIIFCTIVEGISNHQDIKTAGKIGFWAIIYFELLTTIALALGLLSSKLIKPGIGIHPSLIATTQTHTLPQTPVLSLYEHLTHLIPDSIIHAFAHNNLLQILVFSVLFGIAMALLGQRSNPLKATISQLSQVIFQILHIIIRLAPLAALGAMAYNISTFGADILIHFGELILGVYLSMGLFIALILGSICYFSGINLWSLLTFIKEEIIITLGTASSEAVLPRLMEKLPAFGCTKEVVGLVLPTGYAFNLDGTAIYLSAAVLFIAQAYGIDLTPMQELTLFGLLMLNSKGAAAVTGGGLMTLSATLAATHILPNEGILLLLGIDRLMSEARAITNMIGNSVAAVVIGRWVG